MTRTVEFEEIGGPEVLQFVDRETPIPGPGATQLKSRR